MAQVNIQSHIAKDTAVKETEKKGFEKVKGLIFMFLNIVIMTASYITQKVLLADSIARNNPINPNEWMYWIGLQMLIYSQKVIRLQIVWYGVSDCLITMQYLKESLFPIPQKVRFTYILRCVVGMLCNLVFLFSLNFISFSKASVLFWTSPVFTAVFGYYYLHEHLSYFDWAAVFIAFIGIVIIQNPFATSEVQENDVVNDIIGTVLALVGSLFGSILYEYKIDNEFRFEKAGRVAPFLYLQIIFCCLGDYILFGTVLNVWQMLGGLLIIVTNFTIAVLKCLEIIK